MLVALAAILIIWLTIGWFHGAYITHSKEWRYATTKFFWKDVREKVRQELKEWWNAHPGVNVIFKLKKFQEMSKAALASREEKKNLRHHLSVASGVTMLYFIALGPIGLWKYSKENFFDEETLNKFNHSAAGK